MLNRPQPSAAAPGGDAGTNEAYRQAMGHSKRVRRLRVLLPALALAIGAAFIAVSMARAWLPEELQIESASLEDGKLVMQNPAVAGRNRDGISYSMKAERALQDVATPDVITLENIRAQMPVNGTTVATVEATSGIYDRGTNKLNMDTPFTVSLNTGLLARFQSAFLDITGGEMITEQPVSIKTNDASIVAQRLQMTDKGKTIVFEGAVKVMVEPSVARKNEK